MIIIMLQYEKSKLFGAFADHNLSVLTVLFLNPSDFNRIII